MEEIWRDIIITKNEVTYDYSGMYQVSNYGRVRSLDRLDASGHRLKGKIMKPKQDKKGYLFVTLRKDRKSKNFTIHRLVATMFIPNPNNLPVVNHKNELKSDNVWTNLEWCTQQYNISYGTAKERRGHGISKAKTGIPCSEETKKKLSEIFSGEGNPMYGRTGENHPMSKKVICLETQQVFECIKDANEWCNVDIYQHLRGRQKTAGGYHWQYYDDYKRQLRLNTDINNSRLAA